jgi:hypothetical protein
MCDACGNTSSVGVIYGRRLWEFCESHGAQYVGNIYRGGGQFSLLSFPVKTEDR